MRSNAGPAGGKSVGPERRQGARDTMVSGKVPAMSIADDLSRLHELHQRGGLTEAEFALAKARILGETLAAADPRPSQSGDGPASRPALPEYRPTPWPGSAWAAVVALLIVIVIL